MKQHAALLAIVVSLTFTSGKAAASHLPPALVGSREGSEPATQTNHLKATPGPSSATSSPPRGHSFEVNDEKGLLLKCEAPQLNSDPDTDIFNSCTLAPGRTLDDVMHTFIRAIHFVQNEQLKEWAEWTKEQKEKSAQKPDQK